MRKFTPIHFLVVGRNPVSIVTICHYHNYDTRPLGICSLKLIETAPETSDDSSFISVSGSVSGRLKADI